jgi:hypothetical protein
MRTRLASAAATDTAVETVLFICIRDAQLVSSLSSLIAFRVVSAHEFFTDAIGFVCHQVVMVVMVARVATAQTEVRPLRLTFLEASQSLLNGRLLCSSTCDLLARMAGPGGNGGRGGHVRVDVDAKVRPSMPSSPFFNSSLISSGLTSA